jgi:hypothetical protein
MLLEAINKNFKGSYDFFYLPIDFKVWEENGRERTGRIRKEREGTERNGKELEGAESNGMERNEKE